MTSHGARVTPPASRRQSASISTPPPGSIARGATARSAVNSRVSSTLSAPARRGSINKVAPPPAINGDSRESLAANLKHETEQKEQLLVQLQTKEQTITTLTTENSNLSSALNAAETRLSELYTEQARMEEDLSARIEVVDKLRSQVRELEREKRDLHRRYNEQTSTFDAERQAFYDNEQHLKSRIQSLTQARKEPPVPKSPSIIIDSESEAETEDEDEPSQPNTPSQKNQDLPSESEPAEMTSLRLELSTLSTSYGSLQSTLVLLQTQLIDLKRVNNELQEENESYNILLREKTLSGQYDLMKQVGGGSVSSSEQDDGDDTDGDVGSMKSPSRPRSVLDTVPEHTEEVLDPHYAKAGEAQEEKGESEDPDRDALASPRSARHPRHGRRRTTSTASRSPSARGESLADLPITGPGLDLAAELGRAENKDVLEGRAVDDRDHSVLGKGGKRGKKGSSESNRKISYSSDVGGLEPSTSLNDVESMRTEIKSLKDANKALSLYASKIIDRIISQEGFEHVLAVDYDKLPPTPSTAHGPGSATLAAPSVSQKIQRRATMFSRSTSNPAPPSPQPERLTTFDSPPLNNNNNSNLNPPISRQRRSLSFDWRGFSVFGGDKKAETSSLRPLTLKAGASTVTGARKLETQEDEEDRRERERLNATMKLMGIDKPPAPAPAMQKSFSTPIPSAASPLPTSTNTSRFSFFRNKSATGSDAGSTKSAPATHDSPTTLTQEALVQAEAENSLAALDAQERALSAELAKGLSGGFTEIGPRRKSGSRRSRTSGGGSGSTVWSAGMAHGEDDGEL